MLRRVGFFLILTLVSIAGPASTVPMYTSLAKVRAESRSVVIGRIRSAQHSLAIEVERVLRGAGKPGLMPVQHSPDGRVSVSSDRLVAFVDRQGALRWVGQLLAGPSLERGVLRLSGFYDHGPHVVSPGVMSMAELTRYLATQRLNQVIQIRLAFPDGQGGLRPSAQRFRVRLSARSRQAKVSGLRLSCLAGPPSLVSTDWGKFRMDLTSSCPAATSSARLLSLRGRFTGLSRRTGALLVEAFPAYPFLYASEFQRFAQDASIVTVRRLLQVKLTDGSSWTWQLGDHLVDPRGRTYSAAGVRRQGPAQSASQPATATSSQRYEFGSVAIVLSPPVETSASGGDAPSIIQALEGGRLSRCTLVQVGRANERCQLTQLPPVFVTTEGKANSDGEPGSG
jgi:hypothetical protein